MSWARDDTEHDGFAGSDRTGSLRPLRAVRNPSSPISLQKAPMTPHGETASPVVLYVCADRARGARGEATQRAQTEGQTFAREHGLTIAEVVTDTYGEPDPARRGGWRRVRQLAQTGHVTAVLVRWPSAIAPESARELRHREAAWLRDQGVRVRYTWAPLSARGVEAR